MSVNTNQNRQKKNSFPVKSFALYLPTDILLLLINNFHGVFFNTNGRYCRVSNKWLHLGTGKLFYVPVVLNVAGTKTKCPHISWEVSVNALREVSVNKVNYI